MTTTKKERSRGRPREFDRDEAVAKAQAVFHQRGYDAVNVAELGKVLEINPPSLYAAFGSKLGLYTDALHRYSQTQGVPFGALLEEAPSVGDGLGAILKSAAQHYADTHGVAGCMVLEGMHCSDVAARDAAQKMQAAARQTIADHLQQAVPSKAEQLTDFMTTTLAGLSASARNGHGLERLLATADMASQAVRSVLGEPVSNGQ
ncbi:TetR/AcrR family transcriptional regulator [Devosia sp. WQ 349]|uniref:TetR/AcrR family transcriptional regulator n=1 Tax=Devosia sp. WQ 349K1 TaxID=2800329 RepID=UPI0019064417|nr:TetR/AcrR family transcriptional regulator [Devosia sp. WQ 349K1]MBK1793915.1 TetR/AcrR family transcriptional regulator [Devosia sp. WQ 349K1]